MESSKKKVRRSGGIQIVVKDVERPRISDPDRTIDWIFRCLGFGDERDELAKQVFRELVTHNEKGVRSKEIQEKAGVTQGAVVYHLNTFMRSGMIIKRGRYYYLKRTSLDRTLEDMEMEMVRRFEMMRRLAKKMEEEFENL